MSRLRERIGRLEAALDPADTSPVVATLRCLDGRTFSGKGLSDYVRDTPPGAAHPIRGLIAHVYMDAALAGFGRSQGDSTTDGESARGDAEAAVRELDEMIVNGEIRWLAGAIEEWERTTWGKSMNGIRP